MLKCELPRRARTPHKDRSAKGSFRFPFSRAPRSPVSPTLFISTTDIPLSKSHKRSGSSLSDVKLPHFRLGCSTGRIGADTDGGRTCPSPAVPPKDFKGAFLSRNGTTDSLVSQAHIAATANLEFRGETNSRRVSIPEELLSASALKATFEKRPCLERSFSVPLLGIHQRTTSFAEHLDQRRIDSSNSSPVSTDSEAELSDTSRGRARRAPPPPIQIPKIQHRRQVSVPINSDLEAEKLPSIAIIHRRNPTPPSSTRSNSPPAPFAVRPPSLQSLAPLLDITRTSLTSIDSTDSSSTVTPAQIVRADRISSLKRSEEEDQRGSVPLSKLLPPTRPRVFATPAAPERLNVEASSPSRPDAPPLTATAFPLTPNRNSVAYNHLNDKHFSSTSFDIQTLPFLSPSTLNSLVPPLRALPPEVAIESKGAGSKDKLSRALPALVIVSSTTKSSSRVQQSASSTATSVSPSTSTLSTKSSRGSSPSSAASSHRSIATQGSSNLPDASGSFGEKVTVSDLDIVCSLRARTMASAPTLPSEQATTTSGNTAWPVALPKPTTVGIASSESAFVASIAAGLETIPPSLPYPWKTESLAGAKKALSSKQLQDIMTDAIKASADKSPELVTSGLAEIPKALVATEERMNDVRDKLQGELVTRAQNLSRLVACLRAFNGNEGARFAETLVNTIAKSDQLAAQMSSLTEHTSRLELLQERHYRAATTLSLVKLNGSFVRAKETEKLLRHQLDDSQREKKALAFRLKKLELKFSELSQISVTSSAGVKSISDVRIQGSSTSLRPRDLDTSTLAKPPTIRHSRSTSVPTSSTLPLPRETTTLSPSLDCVVESPSLKPPPSRHCRLARVSSPPPCSLLSNASPTIPELPGSFKSKFYSKAQEQIKRTPSLRQQPSMVRTASAPIRSRAASEPVLYDSDPFAASPLYRHAPPSPDPLDEDAMETLELTGQISAQFAKTEHSRSRSGTNLSSISLSELDSHTLAQMLIT